MSRQTLKRWTLVLVSFLILGLTLLPLPSAARNINKAGIVIDGRVIFEVGAISHFSASERADIINKALAEEVRSQNPLKLTVVQENQQTIIRNQATERHLLTVTKADVISASNPLGQALLWRESLENSLKQGQFERTEAYLKKARLSTLGIILGAIALHLGLWGLGKIGTRKIIPLCNKPTSSLYAWKNLIQFWWKNFLLILPIGLWLAVFYYVTELFPNLRNLRYQIVCSLQKPIITLGQSNYSALELLSLLALTIGLWFLVQGLTLLFKSYVLKRLGADKAFQDVVAIITQYILTFLGLIILWQMWGLDVNSLTILASVLGVGIGFGLQNIANNFISGLIITLERPIKIGDFIKVGELMGIVQRIGARSTEIKTPQQISIIVPNSRFLESEVINWSYGDPVSAINISVGVAYGSDTKRVKAALLEAAKSHPDVLLTPRPLVLFKEFGESSLKFDLIVWFKEPRKQFRIKSDLNFRIEEIFRRYKINIPFPQQDLHLRSPQLDQLITVLLHQQGISPNNISDSSEEIEMTQSMLDAMSDDWYNPLEERLSDAQFQELIFKMRSPGGLDIKDRRYRLHVYHSCFVGSEAVDWLVQNHTCTREEAIELGQILVEKGIIHHVIDQHPFEDSYLFYRFYADER